MEHRRAFVRTVGYAALSALLTTFAVLWQRKMHTEGMLARGFSSALFGCFVIACCLIGGAAYAYVCYVRRHPPFRSDVLLCGITGLVLMVLTTVCFLNYGGVDSTFTEKGYVGANFLIVLTSVLPLPFVCRMLTAATARTERRGLRYVKWGIVAAVLIGLVTLTATGNLFETMVYKAGERGL